MIRQEKEIKAILSHLGCHSRLYLVAYTLLLLILGLWPFNFIEKNNAAINLTGGLEVARHGTAYTALPAAKLQDLKQFAILIDITTSSDGLGSLEKIFGYFIRQEYENFFVAQWKDGIELRVRTERNAGGMIFGEDGVFKKEERVACLIIYDGLKMHLYKNGSISRRDNRGPLSFSNWDKAYPLVVGTDATGRSQWKGCIYQIALWDRALSSKEIDAVASGQWSVDSEKEGTRDEGVGTSAAVRQERKSGQPTVNSQLKRSQQKQTTKQENPPVSPFMKGGGEQREEAAVILRQAQDDRPLIHYVFRPENTYETEFRGKRAVGVRDLGKGEPADLVIPEHFMPYQRVYLGWDPDWVRNRSDLLDIIVNIIGFIPFGMLLTFAAAKKQCLSVLVPECLSGEEEKVQGFRGSGVQRFKGSKIIGLVLLTVVAGFVVSFAIEYLQVYLPSRDSSLRDLFCNTVGTAMGAVAAAYLLRHREAATSV